MVKSFINAFFSGIGRTFGRILAYIIVALIFFFIYENAHAASIYGQSGCNSTYYNITKQDGTTTYGQTSTSYNIAWETIGFYGTENLDPNTFYDVKIVFRSNFTISALNEGPEVYSTSSLCGSVNGQLQVSGFGVSGSNLSFRILTNTSMVDHWRIWLPFHFNGSNGINSVTFTKVDISGSSGIIENNNNNTNIIVNNNNDNTQDIINNNNSNTQELKDTIDASFNNCRSSVNLWNLNSMVTNSSGITVTPTGFTYYRGSETGGKYVYNLIHVDSGKPYTMSFKGGSSNTPLIIYYDSLYGNVLAQSSTGSLTFTSSTSRNIYATIIINSDATSFAASDIMFYQGSGVISYEPYGEDICTNRLDDVTGAIGDLNSSLNDTSDVDSNIFSTWLNNYNPIDNPLGSVITLPISLAEKIVGYTDDSCMTINLGSLLGTSLLLRCFSLSSVLPENASSLISTIDAIMSISLLVVIIKNSYETIANIISLGGENMVKSHFRLPTPLEFMSSLLNGNGYSEYVYYR